MREDRDEQVCVALGLGLGAQDGCVLVQRNLAGEGADVSIDKGCDAGQVAAACFGVKEDCPCPRLAASLNLVCERRTHAVVAQPVALVPDANVPVEVLGRGHISSTIDTRGQLELVAVVGEKGVADGAQGGVFLATHDEE